MILDRLLRNVNVPRNLRVRFAGRQETQDLILASSKPRELFVPGKHRALTDTSEDLPSYGWIEETLALTYAPHRPDQLTRSGGLQHITRRSRHDGCEERFVVRIGGQHQHITPRDSGLDFARSFDSAPVREANVHKDDIGLCTHSCGDCVRHIARFGHDSDVGFRLEDQTDACAYHIVVFGNEHSHVSQPFRKPPTTQLLRVKWIGSSASRPTRRGA